MAERYRALRHRRACSVRANITVDRSQRLSSSGIAAKYAGGLRHVAIAALSAALFLVTLLHPAPLRADIPLATPQDMKLTLRTDQVSYVVNSPIRVQIQIQNISAHGVWIDYYPPWMETVLIVRDSKGSEVHHGDPQPTSITANHRYLLGAGKTIKLTWGQDWSDIRSWGYSNLPSGRYDIEALPNTVPSKDQLNAASNRVTVTIHDKL